MTDTAKRAHFSHSDIVALIDAYKRGGVTEACRDFHGVDPAAVEAKLISLGLVRLDSKAEAAIAAFVEVAKKDERPVLFVREATKALRAALP